MSRILLFSLLCAAAVPACTRKAEDKAGLTPTQAAERLAARGRATYMAQCISCHNADPKRDGALGPSLAGSSRELIELRLLRAEYPSGYSPKRPTKTMPAMPHLKREIDAIHAYLSAGSATK